MARVTEDEVRAALTSVLEPQSGKSIIALDMVEGLVVKDGNVGFALEVPAERGAALEPVRQAAEETVKALAGVLSVTAVMTAHKPAGSGAPAAKPAAAAAPKEKAGT
ncbi:MAG: iron-sulfur cluster assembly protein, partial [Rhodospirillaceae bacterium]|nr:iron-sulfur cluster assembly protein [Rhodospirillaceae bacterium]